MREYVLSKGYPQFEGVPIRFISYNGSHNFYINGAIHTSLYKYYYHLKGNNSTNTRATLLLMHEFGHHLQRVLFGESRYNKEIVPASAYSQLFSSNHDTDLVELHASTMAYYYFGMPQGFEKENQIDRSLLSDELKMMLLYRIGIFNLKK